MITGKYIFVTGAPGSKWSSVVKNIYYSPSIDRSDYSSDRTYCHSEDDPTEIMHFGAYFDPGMEFGNRFHILDKLNKMEAEEEFNRPFSGTGFRIIKSHVFAHHLNHIKKTWPDCPIVIIQRDDDNCLNTWIKAGGREIVYPNYEYFAGSIAEHIRNQNKDISDFIDKNDKVFVMNNRELCDHLRIEYPPEKYRQDYKAIGVRVVIA